MQGVSERRDKAWLLEWIRNSPAMIEKGDSLAVALFNEFNKLPMTPFPTLADTDIEAILQYITDAANQPAPVVGEKPSTKGQEKEWTEVSQGFSALTLIPLLILAIILAVIWLAGQKIPGMD